MPRKKPGPYAPLSAHYADDDRIMAAGEEAELFFVRALAYCARTPKTEGHLTHAQIRTRIGLDGAETRAEKCAEVGLLEPTDSGYRIVSWLKWNLSADEIERVRTQDRNRKATAVTSGKSGTGSGKQRGTRGMTDDGIRVPYTETDTETETGSMPRKRGTRIPEPFVITDAMADWAKEQGFRPEFVVAQTERFKNYWLAKPGKDGVKLDWRATWKNWLLKAADDFTGGTGPSPNGRPRQPSNGPVDWEAAMARAQERDRNAS